jgi:hypothetical protein
MNQFKKPKTEHEIKLNAVLSMCELFRPPLSDDAAGLYVAALEDLTAAQVVRACARLATTARFRPVPADVREAAGAAIPQAQDRATLAFQALKEACSRVGLYRSPDFDDPLINATVRNLGGWTRACEMPCSEFDTWYRRSFVEVYEMFCRTGADEHHAAPLVGELEQQNLENGHTADEGQCRTRIATGLPWAETGPRRIASNCVTLALEDRR